MIKKSVLLSLVFACLPMLSNANVISLEYTGHVTTLFGRDMGYGIGDTVGGKLEVDLSKATYAYLNTPTAVKYIAPIYAGLITAPDEEYFQGSDYVDIYNNSYENWEGDDIDFFQILDARPSTLPDSIDSLQITVMLKGFDWLTDLSLNNMNIATNDASVLGWSFGAFNRTMVSTDSNGDLLFDSDAAIFSLDSLKLVSSQVPEPNSIALMLIGGLALVLRRRRS